MDYIEVLQSFGVMGLWGVILYKLLGILEGLAIFLLTGWGIKKGWPHFKKIFE